MTKLWKTVAVGNKKSSMNRTKILIENFILVFKSQEAKSMEIKNIPHLI